MKGLKVISGRDVPSRSDGKRTLDVVYEAPGLIVEADPDIMKLKSDDGRCAFIAGEVIGIRSRSGRLERVSPMDIKGFIFSHTLVQSGAALEGRYILAIINKNGDCEITLDHFGQADLYYMRSEAGIILANGLDLMPVKNCTQYDQASLSHVLTVYGYRPPKRHTIYSGIHRLGVGEVAQLHHDSITIQDSDFKPIPTARYDKNELGEYADTLLDAIEARGSCHGNVVYLSSGWDSSAILACLVHIYGARKVRAVTGKMLYNERTGTINQFELARAEEIANYFGIPLDIVEFDYWKKGPEYLEEARELFKAQQMTSITALNHLRLADGVARTSGGDEAVFVGEISDGAHNLGFSQFVTIFHPDVGFREYSDKMASYLFGPTFMGLLEKGTHNDDPVYNLLCSRSKDSIFDEAVVGDTKAAKRQLLESFFLRNSRLPLFSRRNVSLLTKTGQDFHNEEMGSYLDKAANDPSPSTLYSWYLHLYNSFHWQGSTVACIAAAGDKYGLDIQMPFGDSRLIDFLSAMPEDWGRGLEPRPTKYPLKWMLKNRIDYPIHLQIGPHSYLYDVDPNFSHSAEILYGSSFTPHLKELLGKRSYEGVLNPEIFDMAYINEIVSHYLSGHEVIGGERNDLFSLCMLEWAGDYLR